MLSGKVVLAEMTTWDGEAGPLAVSWEGRPVLLEREQINGTTFEHLRQNRELVGGLGTNAYLLDFPGILTGMGLSREHLSAGSDKRSVRPAFDRIGRSLRKTRLLNGKPVIYQDHRVSALTLAFESLFVQVPRSRPTRNA